MFNRFAETTRRAVLAAARQARAEATSVTDEHLLRALLRKGGTRAADLLADAGVTESAVTAAFREAERRGGLSDAEATALLTELGIDLDQVVGSVEEALGERVLAGPRAARAGRFAPAARSVLRGALGQAKSMRAKELGDEHLLLALAADDGVAGQVLAAHGLTYLDIRTRLHSGDDR